MIRLGVDWRPHKKDLSRRWFWEAWKRTPLTHVYDPITGQLLMVNGVRYKEGDPSECEPSIPVLSKTNMGMTNPALLPPVPPENKGPKNVPPSTRLAQLLKEIQRRKEQYIAEKKLYEENLELMAGSGNREKAIQRWSQKHDKQPVRS